MQIAVTRNEDWATKKHFQDKRCRFPSERCFPEYLRYLQLQFIPLRRRIASFYYPCSRINQGTKTLKSKTVRTQRTVMAMMSKLQIFQISSEDSPQVFKHFKLIWLTCHLTLSTNADLMPTANSLSPPPNQPTGPAYIPLSNTSAPKNNPSS